MKLLVTMFTKDQDMIAAKELHQEKYRQLAEEGFTQIYNDALKMSSEYDSDVKIATVKGVFIGATVAGLIGVGVLGYNKFSNLRRKFKKIKKEEEA